MDELRALHTKIAELETSNRRLALVAVRAREVRRERKPVSVWWPEERELWEALDILRPGDYGEEVPDDV